MYMPVSVWPCECRTTTKATDAAIKARQWTKAVQIVDLQEAGEVAPQHFQQLAEHFASAKHFEVSFVVCLHTHLLPSARGLPRPQHAEGYYLKAGLPQEAESMYFAVGQWEAAYRVRGRRGRGGMWGCGRG